MCEETDLKNNIDQYFNGAIINETESRAVLHTALRSSGNDEVDKTLNKIINISDEINNAKRLGYSGKKITDVVNIGIKSRGVYETPGGTLLMNAHLDRILLSMPHR